MGASCWPPKARFGRIESSCPKQYGPPCALHPAENVAAKGRVPYALLAIMETLRVFPGQVRPGGRAGGQGGRAE